MTEKIIKNKRPKFFGLYVELPSRTQFLLALLPFIIMIAVYCHFSLKRLEENSRDKILPSVSQMVSAVKTMAFTKDARTGKYLMLQDTIASLRRMGLGIAFATCLGLLFGLHGGLFSCIRAPWLSFITFASIIPPMTILPIIFISFGVDELAKVVLIFFGVFPTIARNLCQAVEDVPIEQKITASTLGASGPQITYRIVLPQIMPKVIYTVRSSLGTAWTFLLASEMLAASEGLGYRIFLFRRYLAMDVIFPYVIWTTFLGFMMDWGLKKIATVCYPWYMAKNK